MARSFKMSWLIATMAMAVLATCFLPSPAEAADMSLPGLPATGINLPMPNPPPLLPTPTTSPLTPTTSSSPLPPVPYSPTPEPSPSPVPPPSPLVARKLIELTPLPLLGSPPSPPPPPPSA